MAPCLSTAHYDVLVVDSELSIEGTESLLSCTKMYDLPVPHDIRLSWSSPNCGSCEATGKQCRLRKNSITELEAECYGFHKEFELCIACGFEHIRSTCCKVPDKRAICIFPSPKHSLMSNYMNVSLSPKVSKRVECLRHLQSQHDELEAQFLEERKALEAKYQKLYQPLYTKRCEIVNGLKEVDGVMSAELYSIEEDQATKEKGVPEFWLTAMKTQEVLAEEWSRLQSPEGFKLEFYFNPCPYFKNSVLTKTYHIIDESDHILSQAIGTEIEWYPGKCLTKKVVKKKPRMGSKKTKTITTLKICESFFTFFNPPHIPESVDDLDDDAYDELQDRIEHDYDVGNKEAEQEKKRKQGVKKDNSEHHDEDKERKRCLKKDDDDEKNNNADDEDDNNDKEVEQEEKREEGVKKDINKDHDDSYDEERKWTLKKDVNDDDDEKKNDSIDNDNGFWVRYQPLRFRL
ncbi:hypothetical protein OIU84_004727 [Salix udensis]|uniref:Uncharacterized protein n=1 Tax=Salix udensis TaxID=889485 RepID=A0AAD6K310_9ROSI|nr:hypothetical protein OIU84_004727 [Salix udensis]